MKVVMAPVNIAGQPILLVKELRRQGIGADLVQYTFGTGHAFGYKSDKLVDLSPGRQSVQLRTLKECFESEYDIFHFWLRSFLYGRPYQDFTGLDIPYIKARRKKIFYRFTGFDLRLKSEDIKKNPYSVFRYGYDHGYNEDLQRKYIAFLEEYVDQFLVQDPEMHDFMPRAKIIPRVIDLEHFPFIGVKNTNCPLVVHAPSKKMVKGSQFVEAAVAELKSEGVKFTYKPITGMNHETAVEWYKKADIIIDQLHIGWYGVLALEGMALGKPVIVYIRDELIDDFEHPIPIVNANPDTIKIELKNLIKDFGKRNELSRLSRAFAEEVHDIKKVTTGLIQMYRDVLEKECVTPKGAADLDYLHAQIELASQNLGIRKLAKQFLKSAITYINRNLSRHLGGFLKRVSHIKSFWSKNR